ncbi:glycosyltransferase family 9 protein [Tengunoibacter tsumagoiensis]|uniref:ADP-heptose--LPS heptosyltransferase n=1 Tax=Tengunoibacter tsumagoiensis TaxID=2014871 RepID=A0A401ZTN9_9CHLR|nr:glycosyltransferase family 9 protein [Tengunoibacter tsumagoiensis]GCE10227.1 hypothetical protein KTT_00860 [Tengunoibacter tsumagoiensis]
MSDRSAGSHRFEFTFLQEWAVQPERLLTEHEQALLRKTRCLLQTADEVVIFLGGKAGRLGECVVGTGLLEASLQALIALERAGLPIQIVVDQGSVELFAEPYYQSKYWPAITITSAISSEELTEQICQTAEQKTVLILDFHGEHDGLPYLELRELADKQVTIATLGHLFRVGLRSYAQRGQDRRYADFIENLFYLSPHTIDGSAAQPHILLSDEDRKLYEELASRYELDQEALQIICFFQSVVVAKCYERWDEVLYLLCSYFARHFPQQKLNFLLACGPDENLPGGFKKADMEEWLQDFTGVNQNARVVIQQTDTLIELSVLTNHAILALSNDTGPGHIAGALRIPTITPFLPGNLYSRRVWSSTTWHRGITVEPNPYSYQQLESAIIWGKTEIINSIPPDEIYEAAIASLPLEFQVCSTC